MLLPECEEDEKMLPVLWQLVIAAEEYPQMPPEFDFLPLPEEMDEIVLMLLVLWQLKKEEVEYPQIPPAYASNDADVRVTRPALVRFWKLPFLAYPKIPTCCIELVVRYRVTVWLSPSKWPPKKYVLFCPIGCHTVMLSIYTSVVSLKYVLS